MSEKEEKSKKHLMLMHIVPLLLKVHQVNLVKIKQDGYQGPFSLALLCVFSVKRGTWRGRPTFPLLNYPLSLDGIGKSAVSKQIFLLKC